MILTEDQYLAHYGILRRSGRYPWGSGEDQPARNRMFLDHIEALRKEGMSETEIARGFDMSTTQLRAVKSIARNQKRAADIAMAQRLKDRGWSNPKIAERMGLSGESMVRSLLAPGAKDRADILTTTSEMLRSEVADKKYIDIGTGVENHIGVSKERLNTAVEMLKEEGYKVHSIKVRQLGTGFETELKVLTPPGTEWREVQQNRSQIQQIRSASHDGGKSFDSGKIIDPIAIHPKRVGIRYGEEGGGQLDGVIYVRPGVEDVSLGKARYAQVRVKVGDDHYLKGMAMYKDDLPEGTDILFNTKKSNTGNKLDAMKPIKDDPDLPFGSVVRQLKERHPDTGEERLISSMNIVNEEGDWGEWSKSLSSQMLSKQSPILAKTQLDVTHERRQKELDDIHALTNPTVRKKLLETYADETDAAAVHLKAAAMPRQASHVILPVDSIPPGRIYAPNFRDGERVVLIRHPHGGTFEIPELTVDNKHPEAKRLLSRGGRPAQDAVGIHHSVASKLSGADFDGDTVLVIPNNQGRIKHSPALDELKNFDPHTAYKKYDGMEVISPGRLQTEMGKVSNLITDMTIRQASHAEIARAVRHSMVIIDAKNHELNWRQSAIDNGISQLKGEYQGSAKAGASTLLSRAKSRKDVPDRKPRPQSEGGPIDKATGRRVFVETGRTRPNARGQLVPSTIRTTKLADAQDAHSLSSGTPMERFYADHSNRLKGLANEARLASVHTPRLVYSPSAKRAYSNEVGQLNNKLNIALRNAPRERQAQLLANAVVKAKRDANPDLDKDDLKKIKHQALEEARTRTGARKDRIVIEPKEWDAIQAGAISNSKLSQILTHADLDRVRELATPRVQRLMTSSMTSRAQQMLDLGYTRAEVADHLGVSLTTLDTATKG